ncbi:MAG: hypothetical protein HZA03_11565 [Nitrospinae bacterium]|nr:hypothetical protein [Nitrospinota bacterium]
MTILLAVIGLYLASGAAALALYKTPALANRASAAGAVAAGLLGFTATCYMLLKPAERSVAIGWNIPYGSLNMGADALTLFFLLPVFGVSALAAVYGFGWLERRGSVVHPAPAWFFYNLMAAGMALVPLARNGVFFLFAWELMSVASFFLVMMGERDAEQKGAARLYLLAMHTGAALLFGAILYLAQGRGTADFGAMRAATPLEMGILFALFVIGFGTKAGFAGLHIWMPRAYPAAPPFAAALMAGAMGKLGIYGILRFIPMLGAPAPWMGWTLVAIGAVSGVAGALFALAQSDMRKLLAYSSVENIGIITMGVGFALLGAATRYPAMAALGAAGALFHVLNHAMFKSLLFMQVGSVRLACGTAALHRLGGLYKKLPWTGSLTLIGAAAICGLPPLSGFISEFTVFLAAFKGLAAGGTGLILPAVGAAAAFALIGGLAAAAFAKMFGVAFLGSSREQLDAKVEEPGLALRLPGTILAAVMVIAAFYSPWIVLLLKAPLVEVAAGLGGVPRAALEGGLLDALQPLLGVVQVLMILALLLGAAAYLRYRLLAGRKVARTVTWDCGYAAPGPRMQYSAWSFAAPLAEFFDKMGMAEKTVKADSSYFPAAGEMTVQISDPATERGYAPLFFGLNRLLARVRRRLQGGVHFYILNIVVALLILLLVWKFLL